MCFSSPGLMSPVEVDGESLTARQRLSTAVPMRYCVKPLRDDSKTRKQVLICHHIISPNTVTLIKLFNMLLYCIPKQNLKISSSG